MCLSVYIGITNSICSVYHGSISHIIDFYYNGYKAVSQAGVTAQMYMKNDSTSVWFGYNFRIATYTPL